MHTDIYSNRNIYAEVLVFKTDIMTDSEVEIVRSILSAEESIIRWSIDRDDIDNVLRIESDQLSPYVVIQRLRAAGFACEELPD